MLVEPNTLSEVQWRELEEVIRTTRDIKVYRRAKVILFRNAGYTTDEIQEYTEYSERAQQYWLSRYREEGVSGLYERPRSGRPKQNVPQSGTQEGEQEATHEVTHEVTQGGTQEEEHKVTQDVPQSGTHEVTQDISHSGTQEAKQGDTPEEEHEGEHKDKQTTEPSVPPLGDRVRVDLESMSQHHPKRYLRDRAWMVLLREKGYSAIEIARRLGVRARTVRRVLVHYDQEGVTGLFRKPGSGRISRLHAEQWEQVKGWVETGPKALGYRFVKWTTRSLRTYIYTRFNVLFCREWVRQKLHQFMRYSWTRGKKVYAYPDEKTRNKERKRFAQKMLEYLKQASNGDIILLFEDESILTLFGEVGYSWSPVGETQEVPSAGKRERVVVFGAADPQSGRTHYRIEDDNINQNSTLRFVKQLVRYYQKHAPEIPLVIVLDKHPGHTSTLVNDFVKELEHVTLVNSPTQSPDLNPQEHIWDWLADLMIKNDFFETIPALQHAIRHFFCYIAGVKEQVIRCLGDLQKIYSAEAQKEVEI